MDPITVIPCVMLYFRLDYAPSKAMEREFHNAGFPIHGSVSYSTLSAEQKASVDAMPGTCEEQYTIRVDLGNKILFDVAVRD